MIAISFEAFVENSGKEHDFEEIYFNDMKDAKIWINKKIKEYSGKNFDFEPSLESLYMDDFEVGEWTICITQVIGRVAHDPRKNPCQVKFELDGIKYQLDIDLEKSGFNKYYEKEISPWLDEHAQEKNKILMDDEEIKRQILPIIMKLMIKNGSQKDLQNGFKGSKMGEIIFIALSENFDYFSLD